MVTCPLTLANTLNQLPTAQYHCLLHSGGLELVASIAARFADASDVIPASILAGALSILANLAVRGTQVVRTRLYDSGIVQTLIPLFSSACRMVSRLGATATPIHRLRTQSESSHLRFHSISVDGPHRGANELLADPAPLFPSFDMPFFAIDAQPAITLLLNELLNAIKIIAYLSKYPHIRDAIHKAPVNPYTLIQPLTSPHIPAELRRWAVVCTRNSFKRGTSSSPRRCGNLVCTAQESDSTFQKCSKCKRIAYCR